MKAASQQRRTLSFKEGLLEIKKSMGGGAGQPAEEQAQKSQGKPAHKGAKGHGGSHAPKGPRAPKDGSAAAGAAGGKDERSRSRHGRPQGARAQEQNPGEPGQRAQQPRRPQQPKPARGPEAGERSGQQRRRPARPQQPPAANLSEAEKARIERNRQLNTVWNVFAKHYPAFRDRLPLKIGVAEDLVARHPEYERTMIVAVLKRHVNHPRYHERVAAGGSRYELDGTASEGPGIDPSHVGRANAALARQKAKAEAQAKAREEGKAQPEAKPEVKAEAKTETAPQPEAQSAETQASSNVPEAAVQQPESGETPAAGA
ncbi:MULTISPECIES: ProQ/FINO family protein [unclassified Paraburkholderia]|uniref:ProQ/FINO family protein n=1 Tax=unclassified Paraburkholderia TaxID=2615204 RepID=UPI002AB6BE1A|nr:MULTISPECIES: ProQ/FINO family protein [unclassified Paraburkholderia]